MTSELDLIREYTNELLRLVNEAAQLAGRRGTILQLDAIGVLQHLDRLLGIVQNDIEQLSLQTRQYEELARTTALITSTLSLDEVLEGVIDTVIKLTNAERAYLMIVEERTNDLQIKIARNWDQENVRQQEAQFSRSVVKLALERREPILTTNALDDEQLQTVDSVLNYGLLSILCVPLLLRDKAIGVLYADSRVERKNFTSVNAPLFMAFANQAAISIENARLFDELRSYAERLNTSREQIVVAREEERRRLRRDLHDGLGPVLASLTLTIDAGRTHIKLGNLDVADELFSEVTQTIQTLLSEVRQLVYGLRPPVLDELGLIEAIKAYALPFSIPDKRMITFSIETPLTNLSAALEVTLYRIVVEAITNVVRHSEATKCNIRFFLERLTLCVEITDNGKGLQPHVSRGVGLHSMVERTLELSGTCEITSPVDGGVRIVARFPHS